MKMKMKLEIKMKMWNTSDNDLENTDNRIYKPVARYEINLLTRWVGDLIVFIV